MDGTILIADPVATSRITLKVRLAAAAHSAVLARDVAEAVQACARTMPDAIIVSEPLPGGGIVGLRAALAGRADAASVPIIAICRPDMRITAIRAGADAVIERPFDEFLLLARLRNLLATRIGAARGAPVGAGLAEAAAGWDEATGRDEARVGRIGLVAPDIPTALGWRRAIRGKGRFAIRVMTAAEALGAAAIGEALDLYLIAADLDEPGEGLRLLSELRSRPASRGAAFVIALDAERQMLAPVAFDLGAGDVLPLALLRGDDSEEAALRLSSLLATKRDADHRRLQAEHERRLARADPLTGLANRRAVPSQLGALVAAGGVGVMSLDLDHFKQVNDFHGHPAGDAVLVEVAARLRDTLPAGALTARIGGEEFLAAIPARSRAEAIAWAETLREVIAAAPVALAPELGGHELAITTSVGVIWVPPMTEMTATEILIDVDRALLQAKTGGRNCVVALRLPRAA